MPFYEITLRDHSVRIVAPDAVEASMQFMEYLEKEKIQFDPQEEIEISLMEELGGDIEEDTAEFNRVLKAAGIQGEARLE